LSGVAPRCDSHACNPRMGNLALGRTVLTQSVCGHNATELFCSYSEAADGSCRPPKCGKCNAAQPQHAHLPAALADSSFRFPNTWWQSAEGLQHETLQLDLETEFYFTHLILVFRSPRPAAMLLERSQDFGRTWKPYKYFATNCTETFGLRDDAELGGSECTSKYSGAFPCTRGEMIYRALAPGRTLDPYGTEAVEQLKVTNIRVQLLKRQPCPCQGKDQAVKPQHLAHYALYDFIVKGSCFCNGHAEQCIPVDGYQPTRERAHHVVHGKCICKHNTAGDHCQHCAPLYNDQPWQPANGRTGAPHECKKCKCNGHADSCHFDWAVWLASGQRSGGVCDHCQHNTEGPNCQHCRSGFYRDPRQPLSARDSCKPCACHHVGSVSFHLGGGSPCDPKNGHCVCKPGVGGSHCDGCMVGYWGFGEYGCRPCDCAGNSASLQVSVICSSDMEAFPRSDFLSPSNESDPTWSWRGDELFSALHYSEKCECKEQDLGNPKLFCTLKYAYVLKVKILSAHDKGSHAEVSVKVKKVLHQHSKVKILRRKTTLYPESWTARGCTCPILNPGMEYLVAGHEDRKLGRLVVNMKSFVKLWKPNLGRKVMQFLKNDCKG
ncbi:NET4 protein, partial [Amia calva]|nr:NET4 protein [Amia calva]